MSSQFPSPIPTPAPTPPPARDTHTWDAHPSPVSSVTQSAVGTHHLPPVSVVSSQSDTYLTLRDSTGGPVSRSQLDLRVTALHYANKMLGEHGNVAPEAHVVETIRVAKHLERYLLDGDVTVVDA